MLCDFIFKMNGGEEMKKLLRYLQKNWIRVWLVVIVFLCATVVVFAAYTEVSSVKRVVLTTASPGEPFSSNCMHTTISSRRLTATEFPVSVCNFDQDFPKDYCTTKITYSMTAELKVKINNKYWNISELENLKNNGTITKEDHDTYLSKVSKYGIRKFEDDRDGTLSTDTWNDFTSANGYKVTFDSDELRPNRSSTDIYLVKIDSADLKSDEALFYVFVTATPSGGVLSELSVRLYGTAKKMEEASWSGSILEQNCDTTDYDFYNYVITGGGVGNLNILWNPKYLEVNRFFLEENNLTTTDTTIDNETWKKITIAVDSTKKSRYEFQLFKFQENMSLSSPSDYIKCEFTKSSE